MLSSKDDDALAMIRQQALPMVLDNM